MTAWQSIEPHLCDEWQSAAEIAGRAAVSIPRVTHALTYAVNCGLLEWRDRFDQRVAGRRTYRRLVQGCRQDCMW